MPYDIVVLRLCTATGQLGLPLGYHVDVTAEDDSDSLRALRLGSRPGCRGAGARAPAPAPGADIPLAR